VTVPLLAPIAAAPLFAPAFPEVALEPLVTTVPEPPPPPLVLPEPPTLPEPEPPPNALPDPSPPLVALDPLAVPDAPLENPLLT